MLALSVGIADSGAGAIASALTTDDGAVVAMDEGAASWCRLHAIVVVNSATTIALRRTRLLIARREDQRVNDGDDAAFGLRER